MLQINTKYKIQEKELENLLSKIEISGYEEVFGIALDRAILEAKSDLSSTLSTTYLAWSHNLTEDTRNTEDVVEVERFRIAAQFYRELAHKIYWFQIRNDLISPINGFIQVVK